MGCSRRCSPTTKPGGSFSVYQSYELRMYGVLRSSEVGRRAAVVRFRPFFLPLLEWCPGSGFAGVLASYPSGR